MGLTERAKTLILALRGRGKFKKTGENPMVMIETLATSRPCDGFAAVIRSFQC